MLNFARANGSRPDPMGLLRPRLLAPLLADDAPRVVVVIAPPGSGKTSLLSRAAALSPRPAAWYEAGPGERSGRDFVRHLARAATEHLGEDLGLPETAVQLMNALEARPDRPLMLVLDDVHELAGSSAERELADIVRWHPRHVHVALGTRRPLGLNTPRLMVSGDLVELDAEALRFRSWEVEELFRLVYGEPLSPEGAAALTRRTGGWAAGLMLFHLATSGKSAVERERAVHDLGGRSRLLRSYLTRTVLDELEPERREFLLATCTLGTLTAPLCDALMHRAGSAAVLEDLALRQFFVTIDESGQSYRFHPVLQTLLEGLVVDELGNRAATDLYARSALLLESEGLAREALRAYALAKDFASVARVLQQSSAGLTVEAKLAQVAEGDDPWLALMRARRLRRAGSIAAAVAGFREAEGLLDDSGFRQRCGDERAVAQMWLADASLPDHPAPGSTTAHAVTHAVRAATSRLPAADQLPRQALAEGVVLLLAGDVRQAARKLAHVVTASKPEQLYADLTRVVAEIADTASSDPVTTLEQIILTAEGEEQPWVARLAHGIQAAVLLVTRAEPWRVESCASLVEECERSDDTWGAALLAGALGVAQVLRRDPAAALWLDRSTAGARSLNAPVLAAWTEHVGAFAARQHGAPDARARTDRARALARAAGLHGAERLVASRLGVPGRTRSFARGIMIRCLGPFGIEAAGTEVPLPPLRPLPRTLLLLLALNQGRAVHREVIIDQLWPGTPLDAAAHRLHAAASSVRRCLAEAGFGGDVVRRHGSAYSLLVEGSTLDVAEFEAHLRQAVRCEATGDEQGALAAGVKALEAYQGDLLDEAGPAEWVVGERNRLRVAAATAAYSAGQLSLRLRSPADALPIARRATELDPPRDSAWALLAEIQERMGDRGSAAATRREHALVASRVAGPDARRPPVSSPSTLTPARPVRTPALAD